MRKFVLFLLVAAAGVPSAHAILYVWVDGQNQDSGSQAFYNQIAYANTVVSDGRDVIDGGSNHTAFRSTARIGQLRAFAHTDAPYFNGSLQPLCWGRAQFADELMATSPTGSTLLRFLMPTSGTLEAGSAYAIGFATLDVSTTSDSLHLGYRVEMLRGVFQTVENTLVGEITVPNGVGLSLRANSLAYGRVNVNEASYLNAGADFSSTSNVYIEVLTPGASFTTESGHTYAPVPEPASLAALATGAGCLLRRRRPLRR